MLAVARVTTLPFAADAVAQYLARVATVARMTPDWAVAHPDGYDVGGPLLSWDSAAARGTPGDPRPVLAHMVLSGWTTNSRVEVSLAPAPGAAPATTLCTRVEFEVRPEARVRRIGGPLHDVAAASVARLLDAQHTRVVGDLASLAPLALSPPRTIAITGSSGLIGRALAELLRAGGHRVVRIVRPASLAGASPKPDEVLWQPPEAGSPGSIDARGLEGLDAVVHLAGEGIASGRWTRRKRERIRASRVEGTRLLARTLAALERRPSVLVMASGIGYYGDRAAEELTESSSLGSGFLAEVARDWEAAADAARSANIRVVALRIGQVLSLRGGALPVLVRPFRLGLGPIFASGEQYWSWITLDDVLAVINRSIASSDLSGPINTTAPVPVTMAEFAGTLARLLERPLFARVPAWTLKAGLGDMAEAVLTSTRAVPDRLRTLGFTFRHPRIEGALRWELGTPAPARS
jgi:uncharacterized protein (TIGR01777 family)